MISNDELRELITKIHQISLDGGGTSQDRSYWNKSAAKALIFIDNLVKKSEAVNAWIPKNYNVGSNNSSILELMFELLDNAQDVNLPLTDELWTKHLLDNRNEELPHYGMISLYELILSRCCSLISQILGDRFPYVQKLLIKNLFEGSPVRSFLASDIYMFILRLSNQQQKAAICQLIMNLCKLAPPQALTRGASLINRVKHPFINFESPRYRELLNFNKDL